MDAVLQVYRNERGASGSFLQAIQESLAVVLSSPGFLYFSSPGESTGELSGIELACRQSYMLWSSAPDEELYAAADAGRLPHARERDRQVDRMLDDPRSARFVAAFVSQWMELDWLVMIVVEEQFQFTEGRRESARQETLAFFESLIRNDLSAKNLIDSEFVMIDEVLLMVTASISISIPYAALNKGWHVTKPGWINRFRKRRLRSPHSSFWERPESR